jgi:hypothetical protein
MAVQDFCDERGLKPILIVHRCGNQTGIVDAQADIDFLEEGIRNGDVEWIAVRDAMCLTPDPRAMVRLVELIAKHDLDLYMTDSAAPVRTDGDAVRAKGLGQQERDLVSRRIQAGKKQAAARRRGSAGRRSKKQAP